MASSSSPCEISSAVGWGRVGVVEESGGKTSEEFGKSNFSFPMAAAGADR
jgi:hypothetical protein